MSLLFSLFIYLFYRSEQTVVNEIFQFLFTGELYFHLKHIISTTLLLPNFLVFSLPEGLWVLAVTIASKNFFLKINGRSFQLAITPIIIAISLELFQLGGITNGTFDWWDLMSAISFWSAGYFLLPNASNKQELFKRFNSNSFICLASYLALYLSHVSV
jgi:hypothetical protein